MDKRENNNKRNATTNVPECDTERGAVSVVKCSFLSFTLTDVSQQRSEELSLSAQLDGHFLRDVAVFNMTICPFVQHVQNNSNSHKKRKCAFEWNGNRRCSMKVVHLTTDAHGKSGS